MLVKMGTGNNILCNTKYPILTMMMNEHASKAGEAEDADAIDRSSWACSYGLIKIDIRFRMIDPVDL